METLENNTLDVPDNSIEAMLAKIDGKLAEARQLVVASGSRSEYNLFEIDILLKSLTRETKERIGFDEIMSIRAEMQQIYSELVKQILEAGDFSYSFDLLIQTSYTREMIKNSLVDLGSSDFNKVALMHAREIIDDFESCPKADRFDSDKLWMALRGSCGEITLVDEVRGLVAKAA